ncbi:AP-2 complex subunit alpha [Angomonas deanei]|nr:AP-2 complex subunit alpha [Angomonas deanei]|eukprot:EPY26741.1 AP-2 complex subunit alpha [Angomonas deanei]
MDMRGLAHFIGDIRRATGNRKEEEDRVNEELAKIRAKFIDPGHMTAYDRKKYVCKLMFISILGYPITFGHMEGLKLMAGNTPSEKLVGYLSMTVLINENSELLTLTTHTVYRDLVSQYDLNRGLALTAVAHTERKDFAEVMLGAVQTIILTESIDIHIRKKALLTLLRVYRKYPEMVDLDAIIPAAIDLISSPFAGVSMCAITFLNGCIKKENEHKFHHVPKILIDVLSNIIIEKQTEPGYVYYGVPAPWLQSKILRFLQYFSYPKDTELRDRITLILRKIIKATDKVLKDAQAQQKQRGTQNRVSAMNAILFEVVSLSIQWKVGSKIILDCVNVISSFLTDKKESNLRYVGLTLLSRLSFVDIDDFDFQAHCKQHQPQIIVALHDADVSIRKKALDVLIAMCNPSNADEITKELLTYLPIADEPEFKASLVLSIALLAEKYCADANVYIDTMLTVVAQANEVCPPELTYRVAQVVVNDSSVQKRAASLVFSVLKNPKKTYPLMARVGAFILGEFGYQIALNPDSTPITQFTMLSGLLEHSDPQTQSTVISALFKFFNTYDSALVREKIVSTLEEHRNNLHPEVQQRAHEYLSLIKNNNNDLLEKILRPLPPFDDTINTALECVKNVLHAQDLWAGKLIDDGLKQKDKKEVKKNAKTEVIKLSELSSATSSHVKVNQAEEGNSDLDRLFHVAQPPDAVKLRQSYKSFREQFAKLLFDSEGCFFFNDHLQLTCSLLYRGADCRAVVTVHDVKGGGIKNVSLKVINTHAGLLIQTRDEAEQSVQPNGSASV